MITIINLILIAFAWVSFCAISFFVIWYFDEIKNYWMAPAYVIFGILFLIFTYSCILVTNAIWV